MTKPLRHTTIVLAALLAAFTAGLATAPAHAAPAALEQTTDTCWLDVINDWLDNSQVDKTYAIPCYTQAIQHLNEYPDVKGYSSAIDDIQRAQLAAIHQERNNGGPLIGGGGGGGNSGGGGIGGGGGGSDGTGGGSTSGHSGIGSLFGVHDATSIPLPLIVLGALAVLLALAALGTWAARRFQDRRTPAPAPAVAKRR